MIEIFSYNLSYLELSILAAVGVLIGMAKTGVQGMNMIAVPLLAIIFGGRESTGIMLPILIFADFFGVRHYHQHAEWHHLRRLLPLAFIGVIIATISGAYINDEIFLRIMAVIIILSLVIMIWREKSKPEVPTSIWFVVIAGVAGGFTTMIGNLAGSVMALYLLAMQIPKNHMIGTAAWFFLVINISKLPFHIFVWETITFQSFLLDVMIIPAIALGAFLGIRITKLISEEVFRLFVICMTAVGVVAMIL